MPPGTIVELSSEDCFAGNVHDVDDLPSVVCEFPFLNPVTGPIAVEGAEVGDMLAVHFVEIVPARDWAVSTTFPHFGALTTTHATAMLHPALEERVWMYDVDVAAGVCRFSARRSDFSVDLPLDPMHGTVGVAPAAGEVLMSITPAAHGGNMDTPEMRAGVTAYFPVNVPGGMLSIGDGHARQGEGEVCGTAVEAAMNSVVLVDLVKGKAPVSPRLESDDFLMTTGTRPACAHGKVVVGKLPTHVLGGVTAYDGCTRACGRPPRSTSGTADRRGAWSRARKPAEARGPAPQPRRGAWSCVIGSQVHAPRREETASGYLRDR